MEENTDLPLANVNIIEDSKLKDTKNKSLIVTTIIACVIAIISIGFGVYSFENANSEANESAQLRAKLDLVKLETGAEVIEIDQNGGTTTYIVELPDSGQTKVKTLVEEIYNELSLHVGLWSLFKTFGDGSIIKIPDTEIYTASNESYGITSAVSFYNLSDTDIVKNNMYSYAESLILSKGFVKNKEFDEIKIFYNSDEGIYCGISEDSLPFRMSCSRDTWISDENKNLVITLAEAIDDESIYIRASEDNITDSRIFPYQTLAAYTTNASALFYRVSPDEKWEFFKYNPGLLSCDDYDTEDVKNAFANYDCWDETANYFSIVKP